MGQVRQRIGMLLKNDGVRGWVEKLGFMAGLTMGLIQQRAEIIMKKHADVGEIIVFFRSAFQKDVVA